MVSGPQRCTWAIWPPLLWNWPVYSTEYGPPLHIHLFPCQQMVHLSVCYYPSMWMMEQPQPTLQNSMHISSCISTVILPLVTSVPSVAFLALLLIMTKNEEYSVSPRRLSLRNFSLRMVYTQDVPLCTQQFQDQSMLNTALPGYSDPEMLTCTYQRIVESLLYLASWTHPDLVYTVVTLAQWNASPTHSMLLVAKGVLCYLLGTKHWEIVYSGSVHVDSIAFCDTDWATNKHDCRSISRYAFFMYSGLVLWSSSKQKAMALSSTQAEYMSITHVSLD